MSQFYQVPESCGTTILAAKFDGGVIFAADTRTSTGSYVANRLSDKLDELSEHAIVCRSGSAADTQAITDMVRYHLDFYNAEHTRKATIRMAANLFKNYGHRYRDDMSMGVLVGGYDEELGSQIYSVALGGSIVPMELASGGSGSTYIIGYLDQFKPNMSRAECEKFLVKGVAMAISRDGSSGGCIRVAVVTKAGIERKVILGDRVEELLQ